MPNILIAGSGESHSQIDIDYPRPERLIKGNPQRKTQSLYEHPHMSCGIWQCEVGAWQIEFSDNKQEFFQIIDGLVRLHDIRGEFIEIHAGQAGVIPPGFKGIFEVIEAVQKYYVIVET